MKRYTCDFDDFCDATLAEISYLSKLKTLYPSLEVTLFTIPARTSPSTIEEAKLLGPWLQLAPHGWFHTRGECLGWTSEEAEDKILAAKEMGIDAPLFKAPAWLVDDETYKACAKLDYTICTHKDFRVVGVPIKEFIYNHQDGKVKRVRAVHGHLTPVSGNYIVDMIKAGQLTFHDDATFLRLQDAAVQHG